MPYLTIRDLYTHMHPEVIAEITREDDAIVEKAIDAAVSEASMYLGRYDLVQLFGNSHTHPTVSDEYLRTIVKTLACRHLAQLCGSGTHSEAVRTSYTEVINALKAIMTGQAQPAGWPYAQTTGHNEIPDGNAISWYSNTKRNNYY